MNREEILAALSRYTGTFPREAIEAAVAMREEITPDLLRILDDTIARAPEIVAGDEVESCFGHTYALYLLAQFRETRAYPLVVAYARLEEHLLRSLAGDFITEDLYRVLASVYDGDTGPIEALVEDPSLFEYSRSAALRSLSVLVAEGDRSRDEVMAYFKSLFDGKLRQDYSAVWESLAAESVDLYPEEVVEQIRAAYDAELVLPGFMNPHDVDDALKLGKEAVLARHARHERGYITDTVAEMHWWACFDQPKHAKHRQPLAVLPRPPKPSPPAEIGRNDPCPCGSGKKYKKCCLRAG